jgi:hypothetical protein
MSKTVEVRRDFFVSYTGADIGWAEWIAWELEAAGYSVTLQAWDFQAGANFILEMDRAARTTDRTLAVVSPRYLEAVFTQPEWAAALVRDPTGEQGRLVPVRIEECEPEGLLTSVIYIDLAGLDETRARSRLLERIAATFSEHGRSKPAIKPPFPTEGLPAAVERPRFPAGLPPVWTVPFQRNPLFAGREDLLAALARGIGQGRPAALTQTIAGLGGVGKTQLAVEYAYRQQGRLDVVW